LEDEREQFTLISVEGTQEIVGSVIPPSPSPSVVVTTKGSALLVTISKALLLILSRISMIDHALISQTAVCGSIAILSML
jgi:hypothetical protein